MPIGVRAKMCDGSERRQPCAAARLVLCVVLIGAAGAALGQEAVPPGEEEFGPAVRAYLGYLRAEQLVTDDRASRREVSSAYVRRNSNRINALRQMALRLARESGNDYLPELYAVARDELGTLFETPPRPETFREGEVLSETFRFLGPVRAGELFYLFARLDVYEQAELLKKSGGGQATPATRQANAETQGVKSAAGDQSQSVGAQGHGSQPVSTQQAAPASRPRRVPPPASAAEPPPAPKPAKQR